MSQTDNPLKQRLVGAIVLVAIGVIFIPMLLDQGSDQGIPMFGTNIPAKPREITEQARTHEFTPLEPVALPDKIVSPIDEHTPAEIAPTRQTAKPESEPKPSEKATEQKSSESATSTVTGWAVQVGSFADKKNALKLRDRLRAKGYRAFAESVTTSKGRLFRVRVGPETNRDVAEKIRLELEKKKLVKKAVVLKHP